MIISRRCCCQCSIADVGDYATAASPTFLRQTASPSVHNRQHTRGLTSATTAAAAIRAAEAAATDLKRHLPDVGRPMTTLIYAKALSHEVEPWTDRWRYIRPSHPYLIGPEDATLTDRLLPVAWPRNVRSYAGQSYGCRHPADSPCPSVCRGAVFRPCPACSFPTPSIQVASIKRPVRPPSGVLRRRSAGRPVSPACRHARCR
jgi:hypothetical protein